VSTREVGKILQTHRLPKTRIEILFGFVTATGPFQPFICMASFESLEEILALHWTHVNK
jgi:hypothetical protein